MLRTSSPTSIASGTIGCLASFYLSLLSLFFRLLFSASSSAAAYSSFFLWASSSFSSCSNCNFDLCLAIIYVSQRHFVHLIAEVEQFVLAFRSNKCMPNSIWLFSAAMWKGVCPEWLVILMSALNSSSTSAQAIDPTSAALWRGVAPSIDFVYIKPFLRRSRSRTGSYSFTTWCTTVSW